MTTEQIQEIIIKNVKEFTFTNEFILHASEDIAELIEVRDKAITSLLEKTESQHSQIVELVAQVTISELKAEIERLKEYEFMYNNLDK